MHLPTLPRRTALASLALLPLALAATPPTTVPRQDGGIDAETRSRVIDGVLSALDEGYVFPDVAREMVADVKKRQEAGEYDSLDDPAAFANTLQAHLRAICKDLHLSMRYSAEPLPPRDEEHEPNPAEIEDMRDRMRRRNFGFERVERLDGNVGYLDLRGFNPVPFAGETACAAMTFLANTDALIVDLRRNGGGSPAMVALLTSYLFGPEPVHLNSLYNRASDRTHQWWTLPHVPGTRFGPDRPVFVLTSGNTFSAAEEFTYNLKNLGRATIVGETTGGGAHPVDQVRITDHFMLVLPVSRAISPITGTNWEGTGVEPDVAAPTHLALTRAHVLALEQLYEATDDQERRDELWDLHERLSDDLAGGGGGGR